ncbi:DNA-processing protein DprA [Oricola cellulosilytica]|uniref:DNA-protecting protein DprA n=1 Tax=Oricola cellulosilytica TaxID=1429082 RepID=A0A4R0PB54_9HYPH|nr:DNA-processing protein DprA [Oricola cellulosilytica]TCD14480.1 DNA-protecting protein DprA [Oricola cellulosilytica]
MEADGGKEDQPVRFVLSDRQRLAWLRLYRSENVGPATFRDLISHCGSAELALEKLPELGSRGGRLGSVKIATEEDAEQELQAVERYGARIVGFGEPDYPGLLRQSEPAPPLVTIKGDAGVFALPCTGIVGARNASMTGIKLARELAAGLGEAGYGIASGLARGIDRAAHEAALKTGTIAVLAGGIDKGYPPENLPLLEEIETGGGAAITEMPFGWEPRARDFPRRNRIIAALSLGLVVVEAATRSGSLISARFANEMGRLVFAVPGSPLDPRAEGANSLLKNGAIVTTSARDVIEALEPLAGIAPARPIGSQTTLFEPGELLSLPPNDDQRARILSLLGPAPVNIDDIISHTGLDPAQVFLTILELDIAQRIERHSGNRVSLVAAV